MSSKVGEVWAAYVPVLRNQVFWGGSPLGFARLLWKGWEMKIRSLGGALLPLFVVAIAGGAHADQVNCTIAPAYSIVAEGQAIELTADCGTTATITSVNWELNAVPFAQDVPLAQDAPQPVKFLIPATLGSGGTYAFTVTGVGETIGPDKTAAQFVTPNPAKVFVKPADPLAGVTQADDAAKTTYGIKDGACGTADNDKLEELPTVSSQLCQDGKPALQVTGREYFSWTCASTTGGRDDNCYAARGYKVTTATAGQAGGSITSSQVVPVGGYADFLATNGSYSVSFEGASTTCPGVPNGNTFRVGPITAACTVTATFSNLPVAGQCGTAHSTTDVLLSAPSVNLCANNTLASQVSAQQNTYNWTCSGINGSTAPPASCSVKRGYLVTAIEGTDPGQGSVTAPAAPVAGGTSAVLNITTEPGYEPNVTGTCNAGTRAGSGTNWTYATGPVTVGCQATVNYVLIPVGSPTDPGSGLWRPSGTQGVFVGSQSGSAANINTFIPGCLNGLYPPNGPNTGCAFQSAPSYTDTAGSPVTVTFGSGKQVSVRYRPKAGAGGSVKTLQVKGSDGAGVGTAGMKVWLSTSPTAPYETAGACQALASTVASTPMIVTGPGYCPISTSNAIYYLNIRVDQACSGCRYTIDESRSDFQ